MTPPLVITDAPTGLVVLGIAVAWLIARLVDSAVDAYRAHRGQHVERLADALAAAQARDVQLDAARAQLVLLCDQARAHLAVLAAAQDGRHGAESRTAAIAVVGERGAA